MTRERAEARAVAAETPRPVGRPAGPTPRRPREPGTPLPRDVKTLLAGVALVAVAAVGWLAFGPSPEPIVPVLGFVDAGPPPVPRPTPSPTPAFKLPWWK